jgi:hypothetical protein
VIQSRWIKRAGHVEHIREKKNVYSVLMGKNLGKRQPGRPRHRWKTIQKWVLRHKM